MSLAWHITLALGGSWHGRYGCVQAPGHSSKDRGVSIRDAPDQPDGIVLHCGNGADWRDVKKELRRRGSLAEWRRERGVSARPAPSRDMEQKRREAARKQAEDEARRIAKARATWHRGEALTGSPAARYLPACGLDLRAQEII